MAKSFKYNREDSYEANCQLMANFMSYKTARANKHVQQTTTEATAPQQPTAPPTRLTAGNTKTPRST